LLSSCHEAVSSWLTMNMPSEGWLSEIGNYLKRKASAKKHSPDLGSVGGPAIITQPRNKPSRLERVAGPTPLARGIANGHETKRVNEGLQDQ
jgi:hypothetical protein